MRCGPTSRHAVRQASAKVGKLDLPVPFDLGEWAAGWSAVILAPSGWSR